MSTTPLKTINVSEEFGDHSWRQQNHIWSETEIEERMKTFDLKHVPQSLSDVVLQKAVRMAYHTFNVATGYNAVDPPTSAIGYRLIILESVAGVPGMLGGMFRHFRSLRALERDHVRQQPELRTDASSRGGPQSALTLAAESTLPGGRE